MTSCGTCGATEPAFAIVHVSDGDTHRWQCWVCYRADVRKDKHQRLAVLEAQVAELRKDLGLTP